MAKEVTSYDDLLSGLARKHFAPVYLLYGEEDFLAAEAMNAIIDAALTGDERGFNLDIMNGGESDARDILAHASSFPMMAERRVVVVKDADKFSAKDLELLSNYVDHPSPTTALVLVATKPDFRKNPYASIKRNGTVLEFKRPYENQVPALISARVQKQGRQITPEASGLLSAYVGSSIREIQNEIDKLSIYLGEKKSITLDDVAAVVGMSKEYTVFELQKAIGKKDIRHATEIMERMLDAGQSVPFIIVMLTSYFITLLKLADLQKKGVSQQGLATEAKVNPYFLKEYLEVLHRYSEHEIEGSFGLLTAVDEQIKTTGADPLQVMTGLLIRLIGLDKVVAA